MIIKQKSHDYNKTFDKNLFLPIYNKTTHTIFRYCGEKKKRFVEFKVTYILTDLKSQQTWVQKSTFFVDHLGKQAALYSQFTYDLSSSPSSTYLGQITYKTHGSRLVIVIPAITAPHFQWTINVQTTKFKI